MIAAWLALLAELPEAHRVFLLAAHLLPEHQRASAHQRYRLALDAVRQALCEAVPVLSSRPPGALAALMGLARALLSDVPFPHPPWAGSVPTQARRIAGMLLAAAEAEAAGAWPSLGPSAGMTGERGILEAAEARRRLRTVLDVVAEGGEVVLTRRGRRIAKVVGAG